MTENRVPVYAIVRIDSFVSAPEERVVVQAVLPSLEEAEAEVARLNALRDPERVTYFWRATRYYPDGRGHTADAAKKLDED